MSVTTQQQIWDAVQSSMPRGRWVPLQAIYGLVEEAVELSQEDQAPEADGSSQGKWKRNVRNILQERKASGEILWDRQAEYMLPPSGDGDSHQDRVAQELSYRTSLWEKIGGTGNRATVAAEVLRDFRIYGGQQGIFRDSSRTERLTDGRPGVAVSVLHTGRSYADDLGDTELLYHYPKTNRPAAHDQGEIEAAKVAARLRLPVFVILPSESHLSEREVRLGWIEDWDDESEIFLISFGETPPATVSDEVREEAPFQLVDVTPGEETTARTRPGQQRFKFEVFRRYGAECAVCGFSVQEVLDAVHIRPKGEDGADDPRNGLVLCASHHRAFDAGLFLIHPETMAITCRRGGSDSDELRLGFTDLLHLRAHPHVKALKWHWGNANSPNPQEGVDSPHD